MSSVYEPRTRGNQFSNNATSASRNLSINTSIEPSTASDKKKKKNKKDVGSVNSNNGWSLFGLIPLYKSTNSQLSPTSSLSSASIGSFDNNEFVVDNCKCCNNIIKYPSKAQKFKCVYCETNFVTVNYDHYTPSHVIRKISRQVEPMTFLKVKHLADQCFAKFQKLINVNKAEALEQFKPLQDYLYLGFNDAECLGNSFLKAQNEDAQKVSHLGPNIDFIQVRETFKLLLALPVKKPFFVLLTAVNNLLTSPPEILTPSDLKWLLILFELPTLPCSVQPPKIHSPNSNVNLNVIFFESKDVKFLSFKIFERFVGLLSNCNEICSEFLLNWFARLSEFEFRQKIELINLYISYHLKIYINKIQLESQPMKRRMSDNTHEKSNLEQTINRGDAQPSGSLYQQSTSRLFNSPPLNTKKRSKKNRIKIKISDYGYDWHLKTSCTLLSFFFKAKNSDKCRFKHSIDNSIFYNSLVDFINVKQDFDTWQTLAGKRSTTKTELTVNDLLYSVNDYIQNAISAPPISPLGNGSSKGNFNSKPLFAFCQYPFLLSLGAKISIIEYEAKRQMERKAEEAFLHAINKKTIVEVHFKVRVRRDHITNDSLRCIKESLKDLKKSLKVEFIGEPGIDVGGLKKEWFLILGKKLFDPNNGLFKNIEESNYLWFTLDYNTNESLELYYLVGVVLGLAIYNSTILDLKFPSSLYKMLMTNKCEDLDLRDDFETLYPETYANLMKLLQYEEDDFDEVFSDLSFAIDYKDSFNKVRRAELLPNGSEISVTKASREVYVSKYIDFFLLDGVKDKLEKFRAGFHVVINGNAVSLFSPEEIELLLCGNEESNKKFDLESLKSVARYNGFIDNRKEPMIDWFWEFFEELDIKQQKKLMLFITGSDRIPATGIVSMNFKITKIGNDTDRLPIAHTCFNEICLYAYETKEKLYQKLTMAMNESEGFGLK